jgi:replicative DNA helicase
MSTAMRTNSAVSRARSEATAEPFHTAPHNIEAEQALLGAILIHNSVLDRVSGFLEAHHFYDPLHQQIYETIVKLIASGKQATPITLRTFFEAAEPIDAATTVPVYLGKLAIKAATTINARDYGRILHDLYMRRQLILIGEDMVNAAYVSPIDFSPREQIEEAEMRLFKLAEVGENERPQMSAGEAMGRVITVADAAFKRGDSLSGIPTGFPSIDAKLGGLAQGDLIIVACRPSMGKTSFAINAASNVANASKRGVFRLTRDERSANC